MLAECEGKTERREGRWWISSVALGAATAAGGSFPPTLPQFPYKNTRQFGILKELFLEGIRLVSTKQVYLKGSTGMLFCAPWISLLHDWGTLPLKYKECWLLRAPYGAYPHELTYDEDNSQTKCMSPPWVEPTFNCQLGSGTKVEPPNTVCP